MSKYEWDNHKDTDFTEFERFFRDSNIQPIYDTRSDYTTNAPSFYEYLAKHNHLIKILAQRIYDYDKELAKRFMEWDKRIENLPDELQRMFLEWVDDGTLARILAQLLLDDYATKKEVNELLEVLENDLNLSMLNLKNDLDNSMNILEYNVNTNIDNLKNEIIPEINKFNKSYSSNYISNENYNDLQSALDDAVGKTLFIKSGTYLINKPLKINSNTCIIGHNVTFKRNSDIDNMMINNSDGIKGGYSANKNICIKGITFDGMANTYQDKCTMLAFGHCQNIRISECTFKNLNDWHMIELNGVRDAVIENSLFTDYGTSTTGTEMVQIDIARGKGQFPWFEPYDDTTCDNILIKNNIFNNGVRGIGTHSSSAGTEHIKIYIINNQFHNMSGESINGLDWAFTKIHSNHFRNVKFGIILRALSKTVVNHSILDNYISGNNEEGSRGIIIKGIKDGYSIVGGDISGNRVKRFGSHGIGIDFSNTWSVTKNDITTCGKNGIIMFGSNHIIISDNISRLNGENSISISSESKTTGISQKINVIGNIVDKLYSTTANDKILFLNNIVHESVYNGGTNSHSVNNIVDNVFS